MIPSHSVGTCNVLHIDSGLLTKVFFSNIPTGIATQEHMYALQTLNSRTVSCVLRYKLSL